VVRGLSRSDRGTETEASGTSGRTGSGAAAVDRVRKVLAQVVWLLFLLAALFLAVGALLVALDANDKNDLVKFVLDAADTVDLGVFSRDNGIMDFTGSNADTKNALVNWGLGAVAWLVVGRILERIIRP
jgi:hypothetical protein